MQIHRNTTFDSFWECSCNACESVCRFARKVLNSWRTRPLMKLTNDGCLHLYVAYGLSHCNEILSIVPDVQLKIYYKYCWKVSRWSSFTKYKWWWNAHRSGRYERLESTFVLFCRFTCTLQVVLLRSMLTTNSDVASPKILGRGKMFDFRRIILFCLAKRLSKHKMTIYSKNFGNGPWPLCPPPGSTCDHKTNSILSIRTLFAK